MEIAEFPTLTAATFHRRMDSGKSRPALLQCIDATGADTGSYVVKLLGAMEFKETAFICEFMAYHLANLLGIPVPEAAIIAIEKDFVAALPDLEMKRLFEMSLGLNFATKFKSPGFSTWPIGKPIPRNIFQACAEIFAFDALIQNPDRRGDNPNLLWSEEEVFAYDHEAAFSFIFSIDRSIRENPSSNLSAKNLEFLKNHIFFNGLRKQSINYNRMEEAMTAVGPATIKDIQGQIPEGWKNQCLDSILRYTEAMCKTPTILTKPIKEILA